MRRNLPNRRPYDDIPSSLKCPSCNNIFQYPPLGRAGDFVNGSRTSDGFRVPLLLKCGHAYCKQCIESQAHSNSNYICFKCQVVTKLIGSTLDKKMSYLSYDFDTIGRLIAYRSGTYQVVRETNQFEGIQYRDEIINCQHCACSPARMLCLECDIQFCTPCFQKLHFKTSAKMGKHVYLPVCKSDIIGQHPSCPVHRKHSFDLFCINCDQGVCYICDLNEKSHENHRLMTYTQVFQRDINRILSLKPTVEALLKSTESYVNKQRNTVSYASENDRRTESIREGFSHLHGLLQMKEVELLRQCGSQQTDSSLNEQRHFLTKLSEDINSLQRCQTTDAEVPLNVDMISSRLRRAEDVISSYRDSFSKKSGAVYFDMAAFEELVNACISLPGLAKAKKAEVHCQKNFNKAGQEERAGATVEAALPQHPVGRLDRVGQEEGRAHGDPFVVVSVDQTQSPAASEPDVDENGFPRTLPQIEARTPYAGVGSETTLRILEATRKAGGSNAGQPMASGDLVVVRHIIHPNSFYVTKAADDPYIMEISERCHNEVRKGRTLLRADWSSFDVGDLVACQFSLDQRWYRARIIDVEDGVVRKLRVVFIDFGNPQWVTVHETRRLPKSLAMAPEMIYHCSFNLMPRGSIWSQECKKAFHRVSQAEHPFVARVFSHNPLDNTFVVDLQKGANVNAPLSISEWLVLKDLARFPNDSAPDDGPDMDSSCDGVYEDQELACNAWRMVDDLPGGDTGPGQAAEAAEASKTDPISGMATQAELPDESAVAVTCVESVHEVWVTPHPLARRLQFRPGHAALEEPLASRPQVASLCAARHANGRWYRCRVEAAQGAEMVRVRAVDFGLCWDVAWLEETVCLEQRFLEKPYLAHCVALAGISFETRLRNPLIKDEVEGVLLQRPVYRLYFDREMPNSVYLVNDLGCVNATLVERGLADMTDPERIEWMAQQQVAAWELETTKDTSSLSEASADEGRAQPGFSEPTLPSHPRSPSPEPEEEPEPIDEPLEVVDEDALVEIGPSEFDVVVLSEEDLRRLSRMPSCQITAFKSPAEFYVRMIDSRSLQEESRMTQAMQERYGGVGVESTADVRPGQLCAAQREKTQNWSRGRVLGRSRDDPDWLDVEFFDYGDTQAVLHSTVRPLDPALAHSWVALAVRCHVLGVRPPGGGEWPPEVSKRVGQFLFCCDNYGQVSRVLQQPHSCGVDLVLSQVIRGESTEDGQSDSSELGSNDSSVTRYISLRDHLLREGVAEAAPVDEAAVRLDDLILRGRPLPSWSCPAPAPESAPRSASPASSSSGPDSLSRLDAHLYQSNNSRMVSPTLRPGPSPGASPAPPASPARQRRPPGPDASPPGTRFLIGGGGDQFPRSPACRGRGRARPQPRSPGDASASPSPSALGSTRSSNEEEEEEEASEWPQRDWAALAARDDGVPVEVLRVDPGLVFVCRPDLQDGLAARVSAMEARAGGRENSLLLAPRSSVRRWRPGEACFGLRQTGGPRGAWCRGSVMRTNPINQTVYVFFVDHGEAQWLSGELVRPVAPRAEGEAEHPYLSAPAAVWLVKLHCLYPVNQERPDDLHYRHWQDGYVRRLSGHFAGRRATLFVVEMDRLAEPGQPTVLGRLLSNVYGKGEVGDYLCQRGVAYRWEAAVGEDQLFIKSPWEFLCYRNAPPLPVGLAVEVVVSHVETPFEIYLQVAVEPDEARTLGAAHPAHRGWLEEMAQLRAFLRENAVDELGAAQPKLITDDLELTGRLPCMARYSDDGKWYRAELDAFNEQKQARVHFVDYGNYDEVEDADVRLPVRTEVACACRRYRWRGVRRHPDCRLSRDSLNAEILARLSQASVCGLFAKCERVFVDGRLPLVDLFEDRDCTRPVVDALAGAGLVRRVGEPY